MKFPTEVVIVGGGLALTKAPVLSLCLKKQGILSTIYEMRTLESDNVDIGDIGLAPNALRILDSIGVYSRLQKLGWSYASVNLVDTKWRTLFKSIGDSIGVYGYDSLMIKRHLLRNVLREEVKAQGITIHYNMKCTGITKNEGEQGVLVNFADGTQIKADCVVGADGIHSVVRKHMYPDSSAQYAGLSAIGRPFRTTEVKSSTEVIKRGLTFQLSTKGLTAVHYSNLEETLGCCYGTFQIPDQGSREGWRRLGEDKEKMQTLLEESFGVEPVSELMRELSNRKEPENLSLWPFMWVPPLPNYVSSDGSVIVIGDAAHGMPPSAGLGAAVAFEDAMTLAYALSPDPECPGQSRLDRLSKWEKHRMWLMSFLSERVTRIMHVWRGTSNSWLQLLKEYTLWVSWMLFKKDKIDRFYQYKAESIIPLLKE